MEQALILIGNILRRSRYCSFVSKKFLTNYQQQYLLFVENAKRVINEKRKLTRL